ncbi:MAG: lipopolysaccharide biosynthesis protein [Chitinophagales bacterium]
MSSIKKLAVQTVWYGASSIFSRFLSYLLTPYLTLKFAGTPQYGEMTLVYSLIPFLNTLVLFGFETAYFRYIQKKEYEPDVYDTLCSTLIVSTTVITVLTVLFNRSIAGLIGIEKHPEYITISAFIIAADALSALPFARLRHESRPKKFAFIRVASILLNIGVTYFFLSVCPRLQKTHPDSVFLILYSAGFGVGYVLLANLAASVFQLAVLFKEFTKFHWKINKELWKQVVVYSLPLTIAGFAGMVNETFDRILLAKRSVLSGDAATYEVGIYGACYKLSILITLFVQGFRMGAEPFFFKESTQENAPKTYARVMKFFVITICLMFLLVALYIDIWKSLFIMDKKMWEGLKVVPILLFANMFLGIYYNLSIWYRLSHKTSPGAYITLIGAGITLLINYFFIPKYSYMACAWATFLCYGSMMVISYIWGQKEYRIPYAWKKLTAYMVIVALLYFLHHAITSIWPNYWLNLGLATIFTLSFAIFILKVDKKEFERLPYIGSWI